MFAVVHSSVDDNAAETQEMESEEIIDFNEPPSTEYQEYFPTTEG